MIHRLYFSMHARSLINIPSSFRIPLIFLTLLFITRAHKMISCRYGLHKARGYLFLSNAALHTFTLAKHIPWAGYRPSLVRGQQDPGPGPAPAARVSSAGIYSLFSHFLCEAGSIVSVEYSLTRHHRPILAQTIDSPSPAPGIPGSARSGEAR